MPAIYQRTSSLLLERFTNTQNTVHSEIWTGIYHARLNFVPEPGRELQKWDRGKLYAGARLGNMDGIINNFVLNVVLFIFIYFSLHPNGGFITLCLVRKTRGVIDVQPGNLAHPF